MAGAIEPVKLQREYRINPLGIDVTQPRLTWQVQSNQRNQGQSAYQILVTGSRELLRKNQGEC